MIFSKGELHNNYWKEVDKSRDSDTIDPITNIRTKIEYRSEYGIMKKITTRYVRKRKEPKIRLPFGDVSKMTTSLGETFYLTLDGVRKEEDDQLQIITQVTKAFKGGNNRTDDQVATNIAEYEAIRHNKYAVRTIKIMKLGEYLTELDIYKLFISTGHISYLKLQKDFKTGKSKGYGFITFKDEKSVDLAIQNMSKNLYKSENQIIGVKKIV
jgi:hypothetical protein